MDAICSPEMPRRTFMAIIAGGLLAVPLVREAANWRLSHRARESDG